MTPHYDDEILFQYAEGVCPIEDEIEAHVAGCAVCARELAEQREIVEMLKAAEVWDNGEDVKQSDGSTAANLTSVAQRLREEDSRANDLLDELLKTPAAWWPNTIRATEGGRSAGMVRQILDRFPSAVTASPLKALELSVLAVEIANDLSVADYPSDFVIGLRGQATRTYAYALYFVGRHQEALVAADEAEKLFHQTPLPDYDLARLGLVRANICSEFGRHEEAAQLARKSAETYVQYGDRTRYLDAKSTEAVMLWRLGRYDEALATYQSIEHDPDLGDSSRVFLVHSIGVCYKKLGQFDKAIDCVTRASAEFELLGMTSARVRSRWVIGEMLFETGRYTEAIPVLRKTWREFQELGMESEAALVGLELAEALLCAKQPEQVPAICRSLLDRFTRAGMTSRAITALAFLREAVAIGHATPAHVRHVHDFLRDLPAQPARLYAAPPSADRLEP